METILALDFGGTKHTVGLASWPVESNQSPVWISHGRQLAAESSNASLDLVTILSIADQLLAGKHPLAVGVSFGGPVDYSTNTVRLSHHVPGWENFPLGKILAEKYVVPVAVDNDANVAALGELTYGAGKGLESLCYMTVSTGVGGGWILDRKIWHGANNMAGEIGHTVVDPQGPVCLCGKRGCVERLASGPYMAQDAHDALAQNPKAGPVLMGIAQGDPGSITGQMVSQAAAEGDPLANTLLDRAGTALGMGIGNAANLINPQCFILGGGVTKSGDRFWQTVRETARKVALPEVQIKIVPAALGDDAPLWGAVALAELCLSDRS